MRLWCLLIPAVFSLFTTSAQTSNSYWQAQSIYQIVTDRFYDGNTNNNNVEGTYAPGNPTGVHGGDFAGLGQKLDYIKALGATAIWISPIVLNTEGQYHGYSAWNYYQVAPHWGSITDLQNVVQMAHARGLKVIDDIVVNHAGDLVTGSGSGYPAYKYPAGYSLKYVKANKTYPAPFNLSASNPNLTNLWHNYGNIGNFNDSQQTVLGSLDGLNDLRTETTYVRTNMINIYEYWISQIGLDAFRVDTVLEVDHGCWQTFCPAIYAFTATNIPFGATSPNTNFFMFGEVDNGSESTVGPYTGTRAGGPYEFESTEDYPLFYDLNSVFASLSGNTFQIQNHYNNLRTYYDPGTWAQQIIFLDNQDNPRFLSTSESNGNTNALKVALAFLYTSIGIPSLYYGTEQGFDGTTDPDCREDMFAGQWKDSGNTVTSLSAPGADNFNMTHPLFQWIARLNNFRRLYPAMSLGSYVNQWYNSSSPGLFSYSRILNGQEIFVILNTAGSSQTLTARTLTYPTGTVLVNLLNTNETYTLASGSQTPSITVPAVTAKIFIARSQWQPTDPVVTGNSPAHWTTNVPPGSPVVLQFSDSMDTNSVQAAFSTSPSVSGSFSWASAVAPNDTMTFIPASGWPANSQVTVTVSNSALSAATGKSLFAPYSLSFLAGISVPVLIASPANNADYAPGSTVPITVDVSGFGSGLTNIAYYANGIGIGDATISPWNFTWTNVPSGSYGLTAVASGSSGNSATSSVVNVTVNPSIAYDVEANYNSWSSGQNGGYGFQPWVLSGGGQYNGFILAPSGLIDTSGNSWTLYANGSGNPYAYAWRGFSNALTIGEIFGVQFASSAGISPGAVGFCLQNSNSASLIGSATLPPPIVTNTPTRFAFYYGGGQADYTIWDANGAVDSGIPYAASGVTLQFSLLTANTYKLTVLSVATSAILATHTGTLTGAPGSPIQMFAAFNVDTSSFQNAFFNTMQISAAGPVVTIGSNNSEIIWSSTPGYKYRVLGTTNLTMPFAPVSGVITATGLSTSYTDVSSPAPEKFYKIQVVP
ncbi:MAG TPA: alpha-amylase family glycosyl hydrolase [Pseudomonadales bacterium]|nr:alpha-amylase family glycosyl hydrolase [Pseudomonadales bacterium]